MRCLVPLIALLVLSSAAVASAHMLDHAAPTFAEPAGPLSLEVRAGGEGADWELVTSIPTGNPHTDLDFFTIGQDTYMSAGTLGVGPNSGGQNIIRLTQDGVVEPSYVSAHPSAACPAVISSATALQHDVEATPKGFAFQQQPNEFVARGDAQLLLDATDGTGRCHDYGSAFGASGAPQGGIEIIDITEISAPKEIGLISHIGNAHTVNVDPKRPHIGFDITQDGTLVNTTGPDEGKRQNETAGSTSNALDGFELIDFSSCMNFPPGTTIQQKRDACKPQVYRYRYPEARMATSHHFDNSLQSCHEVEIYPDDRLTCASITATLLFDLSNAFDDNGTPNDFTDDKPRGTPLPCSRRESSSPDEGGLKTGAFVTDCVNGTVGGQVVANSLRVSNWLQNGAPSLAGVEWIGTVPHMGFLTGSNDSIVTGPYDADVDIVAAHESELSQSGRFVITSDERGGGVLPGGATCSPQDAEDYKKGNGGLHFFPTANFTRNVPLTSPEAHALWAKTPEGGPAIFRTPIHTQPQATICTSHVFQQIPGQNRIFMGYYSQGTQVFDFTENPDGTISFRPAGYFIPENANSWTSHVFKAQRNQDGTFTYWGAASDGILPGSGRSAIDIWKVTLPPAPEPLGGPAPGTPELPVSEVKAVENERAKAAAGGCAANTAFERAVALPLGRGLEFRFSRRGTAPVTVDLFRAARGRTVADKLVRRFANRRRSFRWLGGGADVRNGEYHVRFTTRTATGGRDVRRAALVRRNRRFSLRPAFYRRVPCGLVETFKLSRPVFGGRRNTRLGISFRLNQQANVRITVRQQGRVVARYPNRGYIPGRTIRLRLAANRVPRRGPVRITMQASRTGRAVTQSLRARKL